MVTQKIVFMAIGLGSANFYVKEYKANTLGFTYYMLSLLHILIVQLLNCVWLFAIPLTEVHQAPPRSLAVCSNSCPLSPWCHPAISKSSVTPYSSCLQSFPASGSFQRVSFLYQLAKLLELQHHVFSNAL